LGREHDEGQKKRKKLKRQNDKKKIKRNQKANISVPSVRNKDPAPRQRKLFFPKQNGVNGEGGGGERKNVKRGKHINLPRQRGAQSEKRQGTTSFKKDKGG